MGDKSRKPHQLPPGRHGLGSDFVAGNQRERILTALAGAVSENGYANTSVDSIIKLAGVSRRTFYEHHSSKEDAFLAAFDSAVGRITAEVVRAYSGHDDFVEAARAGLECCLRVLAEDPAVARMVIVEVLSAGPEALQRRREVLSALTDRIVQASQGLPETPIGPELTAETIVGAVLQVIYNRVSRGEADRLPDLLPDLLYNVLVPFLGHKRAADERAKTLPKSVS